MPARNKPVMDIDHIYLLTNDGGLVADQLVALGLTEGSSRVHTGQGTTNRKFYFENFFLEVLWVHNESEVQSERVKPIGLWQRTACDAERISRFGLCLDKVPETDAVFEAAEWYQPAYFPEGVQIAYLRHPENLSLPWTFRLPFRSPRPAPGEPIAHPAGMQQLTKAVFEYRGTGREPFVERFRGDSMVEFRPSDRIWLHLVFDNGRQGRRALLEEMSLEMSW